MIDNTSPRPWYDEDDGDRIRVKSDSREIGSLPGLLMGGATDSESVANAALIVRAVNAHEGFIATLRIIATGIDDADPDTIITRIGMMELARAAIAKAEGKA